MTDHCAHVEMMYGLQVQYAKAQREAMTTMGWDIQADVIDELIAELESKLTTVQNRDDCSSQLENTRFGDDFYAD